MSDESTKTIKLQLRKPYYEHYLRFIFQCPEGPIRVNRDEYMGKFIFSRVRYSDTPVKEAPGSINLVLPAHGCDYSRFRFLFFTADDMVRINDYIESMAYLDFRMMVQTGVIDLKMDRKTVISVFSDLVYGDDKYEMLKKDEYRKRKKMFQFLQKSAKELSYL